MEKNLPVLQDKPPCLSSFSFAPLIKYLKTNQLTIDECLNSSQPLADITLLAGEPAKPVFDLNIPGKHDALIQWMINNAFGLSDPEFDFYAVAAPLSNNIIYSSKKFKHFITYDKCLCIKAANFLEVSKEITYRIILEKFYGLTLINNSSFVYPAMEEVGGHQRFFEFELVADFIEVTLTGNLPEVNTTDLSNNFSQLKRNRLLEEALPLDLFSLEGIIIIKVRDVTTRECISNVKNILLTMPYFGELLSFENLQRQVQNLIQLPGAFVSLTSIDRYNNNAMGVKVLITDSLLNQPINFSRDDSSLWLQLKEIFEERTALIISNFSDQSVTQFPFLKAYTENDIQSLVLLPLKFGAELTGVFSIVTKEAGSILPPHLHKIESIVPLLALAMEKQSKKMDDEIDSVIKEKFTAVQSSVNWKFTEAARNYINQKNTGQPGKIESIVFKHVFPLYGSIDVRNSSIERSTAIQKDLLQQLRLADDIIKKSKEEIYLFSLQEMSYRIDKYMSIASLVLFPGDELAIQNFLDEEIAGLFYHLKKAVPAVSDNIDDYFFLLNANTNKISNQCTAFEESIAMINNELVKFINQEQAKVQEIYAHYFEYFVTDGIDFNIYIGQSITPDKPFDQFYLKNLKLWQLTTLVKAARKIRNLQDKIPVPLDTTQLILAHSKPLSISFRVAERKFDVDGAYNIHYEIIKKRIDKIKIMGSCERLTQPGKIAVVFAHNKEAQEYTSYIEYLQKEGLLKETIEYFDLEEMPGVRGLKALRVGIQMDNAEDTYLSIVSNKYNTANAL